MSTAVPPPSSAAVRTTTRGTPCAQSWDDAWVAQVEKREDAVSRRICGARTIGGTPCPLPSDHVSGRCRHHGGFPLTGAPDNNRNAVVHGLYSRRLMVCGSHCPVWQSCPMGGGSSTTFSLGKEKVEPKETDNGSSFVQHPDGSTEYRFKGGRLVNPPPGRDDATDLGDSPLSSLRKQGPLDSPYTGAETEASKPNTTGSASTSRNDALQLSYAQHLLKLPLSERPVCPYETSEYNAVVTDVMQRTQARAEHAYGLHFAHQIALMTVMVSRAARALTLTPLTEKMEQTGANFHMSVERPSAALQAFERLSRELRRWVVLIDPNYGGYTVSPETAHEHELRRQCDTSADPDGLAALDLTSTLARKETTHPVPRAEGALNRTAVPVRQDIEALNRKIMDSLFSRATGNPQRSTPPSTFSLEKEKVEPKEIDMEGRASPRAEDG